MDHILSHNASFVSDQPQKYHSLLLKGEKVAHGLWDSEYKQLLDGPIGGVLAELTVAPGQAVCGAFPIEPLELEDVFCLVSGGAASSNAPLPLPDAHAADSNDAHACAHDSRQSRSCSSSSCDGDVDAVSDAIDGEIQVSGTQPNRVPLTIEGGPIVRAETYKPLLRPAYKRWMAKCRHHAGCYKHRSLTKTLLHGRIEPVAFLCGWNDMGADLDRQHHSERGLEPSPEAVAAWAAQLGPNFLP